METIFKAARALDESEEKETGIQYFESCMRYILSSGPQLSKDQLNTVIKQLEVTYKEGSEIIMTLAEVLREEGFEQGIEKGFEQGIEKGRKEGETQVLSKMALRLLTKKFGTIMEEDRENITKLDSTTLEIIIEEIWNYENVDAVRKFFKIV